MKQIFRILTIQSTRDLFRYKSFFGLIFFLFIVDRFIHVDAGSGVRIPAAIHPAQLSVYLSTYLFDQMPARLVAVLFQWRTVAVLGGLFLFKQLISLWPSSDMRRMHRNERRKGAVLKALLMLRWHQVLWDALAVGILCGGAGTWILSWFLLCRAGRARLPSEIWLWWLLAVVFLTTPLILAGFSYSSKVAVLSRVGFTRKFRLFLMLFADRKILTASWLFYLVRQVVEILFVAAIPAAILLFVSIPWLRVLLAGMIATPVYAFLKMASFKFFLFVYRPFPEVREEYSDYYARMSHTPEA